MRRLGFVAPAFRVAVPLIAGLVVGLPVVAAAHPNVLTSGTLRVGAQARLTVFVQGDEGAYHGVDVTFPVSFRVDAARPAGSSLGTVGVRGGTVSVRGAHVAFGEIATLLVDGEPLRAGQLDVGVTSYLDSGQVFHYPPIPVTVAGGGTNGWLRRLVIAGAILVAGGAAAFAHRRHRRVVSGPQPHERSGDTDGSS
jgi:hypothetical protein